MGGRSPSSSHAPFSWTDHAAVPDPQDDSVDLSSAFEYRPPASPAMMLPCFRRLSPSAWLMPAFPSRIVFCLRVAVSVGLASAWVLSPRTRNIFPPSILIPIAAIVSSMPTLGGTFVNVRHLMMGVCAASAYAAFFHAVVGVTPLSTGFAIPIWAFLVIYAKQPVLFNKLSLAGSVIILLGHLSTGTPVLAYCVIVMEGSALGCACALVANAVPWTVAGCWQAEFRLRMATLGGIAQAAAVVTCLSSMQLNPTAEEEVVLTVLPDPPDKSLAAAQAHLKSWRASRRMPLLRADIATNVHTIFTERADLKQEFADAEWEWRVCRWFMFTLGLLLRALQALWNWTHCLCAKPIPRPLQYTLNPWDGVHGITPDDLNVEGQRLITAAGKCHRIAGILHASEVNIPRSDAMCEFVSVMAQPMWRTMLDIEALASAALPTVGLTGFRYKDTNEQQVKLKQSMVQFMASIGNARAHIFFRKRERVLLDRALTAATPGPTPFNGDTFESPVPSHNAATASYSSLPYPDPAVFPAELETRASIQTSSQLPPLPLLPPPLGPVSAAPLPLSTPRTPRTPPRSSGRRSAHTVSWQQMISEDVHVDELIPMLSFMFMVWRMGSVVLQLAEQAPHPTQAPATPSTTTRRCKDVCTRTACCSVFSSSFWRGFVRACCAGLIWALHPILSPLRVIRKSFGVMDGPRAHYALKVALAMTLASFFTLIPSLYDRFAYSYWAATTVGMITDDKLGGTFRNSALRLQGTVAGSIFGFLTAVAFKNSRVGTGIALSVWCFICVYARATASARSLGIIAAFTAAIIMMGTSDNVSALSRIEQNTIGIVILLLVNFFVWPVRASDKTHEAARDTITLVSGVFDTVVSECLSLLVPEEAAQVVSDEGKRKALETSEAAVYALLTKIEDKCVAVRASAEDGALEPPLWRHPFMADRYITVTRTLERILVDLRVIFQCRLGLSTLTSGALGEFSSGSADTHAHEGSARLHPASASGNMGVCVLIPDNLSELGASEHLASITALQTRVEGLKAFKAAMNNVLAAVGRTMGAGDANECNETMDDMVGLIAKLETARVDFVLLAEYQLHSQSLGNQRKPVIGNMDALLFNSLAHSIQDMADLLLELAAECRQISFRRSRFYW